MVNLVQPSLVICMLFSASQLLIIAIDPGLFTLGGNQFSWNRIHTGTTNYYYSIKYQLQLKVVTKCLHVTVNDVTVSLGPQIFYSLRWMGEICYHRESNENCFMIAYAIYCVTCLHQGGPVCYKNIQDIWPLYSGWCACTLTRCIIIRKYRKLLLGIRVSCSKSYQPSLYPDVCINAFH